LYVLKDTAGYAATIENTYSAGDSSGLLVKAVNGNSGGTAFAVETSGTSNFVVDGYAGNTFVGIGSSSPLHMLSVAGNAAFSYPTTGGSTRIYGDGSGRMSINMRSMFGTLDIQSYSGASFITSTTGLSLSAGSGTNQVYLTTAGNLGIGPCRWGRGIQS
jgi:hypothetical protein